MREYRAYRHPSAVQKAQRLSNIAKINAGKENTTTQDLQAEVEAFQQKAHEDSLHKAQKDGKDYKRELEKLKKKQRRTETRKDQLEEQLEKSEVTHKEREAALEEREAALEENLADLEKKLEAAKKRLEVIMGRKEELEREHNASRMRKARAPAKEARMVERAAVSAREQALASRQTLVLKEKGVIPDNFWALVRDLTAEGVADVKVDKVCNIFAAHNGMTVKGSIDRRSVGRINLEGGIASQMHVTQQVGDTKAIAASGDTTSHRTNQYESRHFTFTKPGSEEPVTLTLGVTSTVDHASTTQLRGWKETVGSMCDIYNNSPSVRAKIKPAITSTHVAAKIIAIHSDHAADQKKLAGMVEDWHQGSERIVRGENEVSLMSPEEYQSHLPLLTEEIEHQIAIAGGIEIWVSLSADELLRRLQRAHESFWARIGNKAFEALSQEDKDKADLFLWTGCCMHKDLNTVKAGADAMAAMWPALGLTPPCALPNIHNVYGMQSPDGTAAREHAQKVTEGGGVKWTSLAGALFNHKDDKKGHHDMLANFLAKKLGRLTQLFPDTSNTRFQSHCRAAEVAILYAEWFKEFLGLVETNKTTGKLNNMEKNVLTGLTDIPTLTELVVLALYSQAVSHPHMRQVRGPGNVNMLTLGPLHDQVKDFCRAVIANPDLLLDSELSHETGTLDGKMWQRPEVIYAAQSEMSSLPHLREALVAFFTGTLSKWEVFTSEFAEGGAVHGTPAALIKEFGLWIPATNDINEGALGGFRVHMRQKPTMTVHQHRARTMYAMNHSATYIEDMSPEDRQYLREKAREMDGSQLEKKRRLELAEASEWTAQVKWRKIEVKQQKVAEKKALLDSFSPRLNVEDIKRDQAKIKVPELDIELDWHRRLDPLVPKKSHMKNKAEKVQKLIEAIGRYLERQEGEGDDSDDAEGPGEMARSEGHIGGKENEGDRGSTMQAVDEGVASARLAGDGNVSDYDSDMEFE